MNPALVYSQKPCMDGSRADPRRARPSASKNRHPSASSGAGNDPPSRRNPARVWNVQAAAAASRAAARAVSDAAAPSPWVSGAGGRSGREETLDV